MPKISAFGLHGSINRSAGVVGVVLAEDEGFDCQFAVGKLYGMDQILNWSIKQSTGLFGFRWVRIPILK